MTTIAPAATIKAPFFRTALLLWVLGLIGGVLVLPYVSALEAKAIAAAAASKHLQVWQILALSEVQLAVLLALTITIGLWAGRKLGLTTPLFTAWLTHAPRPAKTVRTLFVAIAAGIAVGVIILLLSRFAFAPIAAQLAQAVPHPPAAWQGFLASFYGAIDEELLMRVGLLAPIALLARTVMRWFGAGRETPLPSAAFWFANIVTALLFGAGHLPAAAAITQLTVLLVVRTLVLNGVAGLVLGWLYRRYGLEWAMVSHFTGDIVLHVLTG